MTGGETSSDHAGQDFCERLAERVGRCEDLPSLLRAAFVSALTGERVCASVGELADRVHRNRRTLYHHFKRTPLAARGVSLKECVDWFLLARAVDRKTPARSWEAVGATLDVHVSRLSRLCARRMGSTLSELEADGFATLMERLEERTLPGGAR